MQVLLKRIEAKTWCLSKPWGNPFLIWLRHPSGLENELIRFLSWKVKITVTSQNTFSAITQGSNRQLRPNITQMSNGVKWWGDDILYPKGQKSVSLWHNVPQGNFSGHYSTPWLRNSRRDFISHVTLILSAHLLNSWSVLLGWKCVLSIPNDGICS